MESRKLNWDKTLTKKEVFNCTLIDTGLSFGNPAFFDTLKAKNKKKRDQKKIDEFIQYWKQNRLQRVSIEIKYDKSTI